MLPEISKMRLEERDILTITINFVHILWWYADDTALLDDFWVLPDDRLHNLKILHRDLFAISIVQCNVHSPSIPEVALHPSVPS
jgi:hypothetical protein